MQLDVSCLCPTYGRPRLLAESIESYLRQDFTGTSELLIVNDNPRQFLICNAPGVRIVNLRTKFKTLGEKYNYLVANARGRYLTPWEDDDVFLPHKLTATVTALEFFKVDYYKLPWALCLNHGKIDELASNLFFCAGIWTRALFDKTRGFDAVQAAADQSIEAQLKEHAGAAYLVDELHDVSEVYYVYCWGGRTSAHLSGWGNDPDALAKAQAILDRGALTGKLTIEPGYSMDYEAMAAEFTNKD